MIPRVGRRLGVGGMGAGGIGEQQLSVVITFSVCIEVCDIDPEERPGESKSLFSLFTSVT